MGKRQVVLVTGCAEGGIGYQYCVHFNAAGCEVYATDVQPLEKMENLLPLGIKTMRLDITSEESIKSVVDNVIKESGTIDVVVNNAGIGMCGPLAEVPVKDIRKNFEVNVLGGLALTQAVVPHMIRAGSGKIVNIGSVAGYVATPWNGSYCATKAALHSITDSLRVELHPFNIQVVLVTPGAIKSNLGKSNLQGIEGKKWNFYHAYDLDIKERADAGSLKKATPSDDLAKKVVQEVLREKPPAHFGYGYMTTLFDVLWFLPVWIKDFFMIHRFGLTKGPYLKA